MGVFMGTPVAPLAGRECHPGELLCGQARRKRALERLRHQLFSRCVSHILQTTVKVVDE